MSLLLIDVKLEDYDPDIVFPTIPLLDTLPGAIRGRFRQREGQRNTNMITFNLKQQHETV